MSLSELQQPPSSFHPLYHVEVTGRGSRTSVMSVSVYARYGILAGSWLSIGLLFAAA